MLIEFKWNAEATFWAKVAGAIALSIVVRWIVQWYMAQSQSKKGWEDALKNERRRQRSNHQHTPDIDQLEKDLTVRHDEPQPKEK